MKESSKQNRNYADICFEKEIYVKMYVYLYVHRIFLEGSTGVRDYFWEEKLGISVLTGTET